MQAVGRVDLELVYFYIRLLYNDFVPLITNRLISLQNNKVSIGLAYHMEERKRP